MSMFFAKEKCKSGFLFRVNFVSTFMCYHMFHLPPPPPGFEENDNDIWYTKVTKTYGDFQKECCNIEFCNLFS